MTLQEKEESFNRRRKKADEICMTGLICAMVGALVSFLWFQTGINISVVGFIIFGIGLAYLPSPQEQLMLITLLQYEHSLKILEKYRQFEYENMKRSDEISLKSLWKEGKE